MQIGRLFGIVCLVGALIVLLASDACADDVRRAGTVHVEAVPDARGPLELRATGDGFQGELAIVNEGKEPLVVSRIAVRGDAADPRAPAKLVVRIADGALPVSIAPGATRRAVVLWVPERGVRLRQLFAHLVVTTSDEQSGDVALGVRAQMPGLLGPLEGHVLSLIIGLPLLGALVTTLLRLFRRHDDALARRVAIGAAGGQLLFACYMFIGFAPDVSRADGNDGLQWIEHAVAIRAITAEIFFGVDGISAGAVLATSVVAFFALAWERACAPERRAHHGAYLALAASAAGALSAMDGLLFVLFASTALVSAVLLVGDESSDARRIAATTKLGLLGAVAMACLLIAVVAVSRHADPTFLVDGSKTQSSFSLPELSRVALGAKGATLVGLSLSKVAFVLVLVASLILLGAFPLHTWRAPVYASASTTSGALVSAAIPSIGVCALLRIGCAVFPEGMRWSSGIVVALGAITAAYGAFMALGEADLKRLAAAASMSHVGFVLLGAGSLTPQGISGAIVLTVSRALSCGLFLVVAGAIEERTRTRSLLRLEGVAKDLPFWSSVFAVAALAQAGIVAFGGWGPALSLLGSLPNYPPLAIVAAVAMALLAAAHVIALGRLAFGKLEDGWERSARLELGRFRDATPSEWISVIPLATFVLLLGLWPAPIFASAAGTVRDLTNAVSAPGPEQIALALGGSR